MKVSVDLLPYIALSSSYTCVKRLNRIISSINLLNPKEGPKQFYLNLLRNLQRYFDVTITPNILNSDFHFFNGGNLSYRKFQLLKYKRSILRLNGLGFESSAGTLREHRLQVTKNLLTQS